ncbi:MAG: Ig-like domain-containing protein, partial [Candidatus Symbiothrix sp.]|nr:Ig-like domain-containing protein [Candidatus Symbiothrix sp.]
PVAGAVLDLSDASTGGLQLPQVTLTVKTGEGAIPDSWNTSSLPDGLIVYNLGGEDKLPEGVYVWKDEAWEQAGSGGSTPLMNVAITPNTPVTLYSTGDTKQLNPAISIADSTTIIWKSSNTDIAVVSNKGVVSPIADGEAEITVSFGSTTSDPVAVTVTTPTCGSPFTAPSDKVYNTAAYSNTGLTNLCWTTTNLQEAGQSTTCYNNNCGTYPTRGYYYTQAASDAACTALNSGSTVWRVPTQAEWTALQTAFPSLAAGVGTTGTTNQLQAKWNSPGGMAGEYYGTQTSWRNWGIGGFWWSKNPAGLYWIIYTAEPTKIANYTASTSWNSVRCVSDL